MRCQISWPRILLQNVKILSSQAIDALEKTNVTRKKLERMMQDIGIKPDPAKVSEGKEIAKRFGIDEADDEASLLIARSGLAGPDSYKVSGPQNLVNDNASKQAFIADIGFGRGVRELTGKKVNDARFNIRESMEASLIEAELKSCNGILSRQYNRNRY